MRRYESAVHHNGLKPGDVIVLDALQAEDWAGEIEAGFLVEVDADEEWPDPMVAGPPNLPAGDEPDAPAPE